MRAASRARRSGGESSAKLESMMTGEVGSMHFVGRFSGCSRAVQTRASREGEDVMRSRGRRPQLKLRGEEAAGKCSEASREADGRSRAS